MIQSSYSVFVDGVDSLILLVHWNGWWYLVKSFYMFLLTSRIGLSLFVVFVVCHFRSHNARTYSFCYQTILIIIIVFLSSSLFSKWQDNDFDCFLVDALVVVVAVILVRLNVVVPAFVAYVVVQFSTQHKGDVVGTSYSDTIDQYFFCLVTWSYICSCLH